MHVFLVFFFYGLNICLVYQRVGGKFGRFHYYVAFSIWIIKSLSHLLRTSITKKIPIWSDLCMLKVVLVAIALADYRSYGLVPEGKHPEVFSCMGQGTKHGPHTNCNDIPQERSQAFSFSVISRVFCGNWLFPEFGILPWKSVFLTVCKYFIP